MSLLFMDVMVVLRHANWSLHDGSSTGEGGLQRMVTVWMFPALIVDQSVAFIVAWYH